MSCGIVDDIEDILKQENEENDPSRAGNKSYIVPKLRKNKNLSEDQEEQSYRPSLQSNVPGVASIYVKTWGCTHNNSDSEYMAGQLAAYGYKLVDDPNQADLWLLNSCTVKNPAEDHFK